MRSFFGNRFLIINMNNLVPFVVIFDNNLLFSWLGYCRCLQRIVLDYKLLSDVGYELLTFVLLTTLLHLPYIFHFFQFVLSDNFNDFLLDGFFGLGFAEIEHLITQ